jgi:hypothetical protein
LTALALRLLRSWCYTLLVFRFGPASSADDQPPSGCFAQGRPGGGLRLPRQPSKGVVWMELTRPRSWLERLAEEQAKPAARKRKIDPWCLPLARLEGRIGPDGIERITSQAVLDRLGVPQKNRTAGTTKRLARIMSELGWQAVQVRDGLTRGGYKSAVRGYCRSP